MTKDRYMALADFQNLWTNRIKPSLPTQGEVQGIAGDVAVLQGQMGNIEPATVDTCMDIISELS